MNRPIKYFKIYLTHGLKQMFPRIFPTENKIAKVDQPTEPVVFGH